MNHAQAIEFMKPYLNTATISAFLANQPEQVDRSVVVKFTQDLVTAMGN